MLKLTHFDISPNLKAGDLIQLGLIRRNEATKRFEAAKPSGKNKTEMILPIGLAEQLQTVETQVQSLFEYQENNSDAFAQDPELGKALEESVHFVSAKSEIYFDAAKIESYFFSAKQRQKNARGEPELGGFIEKPFVRAKSNKPKQPEKEVFFYQDLTGANVYLHYLCQEFIEEDIGLEQAPETIEVGWHDADAGGGCGAGQHELQAAQASQVTAMSNQVPAAPA